MTSDEHIPITGYAAGFVLFVALTFYVASQWYGFTLRSPAPVPGSFFRLGSSGWTFGREGTAATYSYQTYPRAGEPDRLGALPRYFSGANLSVLHIPHWICCAPVPVIWFVRRKYRNRSRRAPKPPEPSTNRVRK